MISVGFVAVGDELLQGRRAENNGAWLGRRLISQGLALHLATVVGDHGPAIASCLGSMLEQCRVVFVSGGLGPTEDDRTKEALAQTFGVPLVEDERAQALAKKHYESRGKAWHPGHNDYHLTPRGFTPVFNAKGLAPGFVHHRDGKLLLAAPGVPREFKAMVEGEFLPLLKAQGLLSSPSERVAVRTSGIAEEDIFQRLDPSLWEKLSRFGPVSSLPTTGGVDIAVSLKVPGERKALEAILRESPLSPHIWSWEEGPLEELIVRRAQGPRKSFALAESCTGGLAACRITDVPGASEVFLGSFVTYANALKVSVLGVKEETLRAHGAVSGEVAREMAQGARERSGAHLALAFSGVAGPGGGTAETPVGSLHLGLVGPEGVRGQKCRFQGDRRELKERFVQAGLLLLLKALS